LGSKAMELLGGIILRGPAVRGHTVGRLKHTAFVGNASPSRREACVAEQYLQLAAGSLSIQQKSAEAAAAPAPAAAGAVRGTQPPKNLDMFATFLYC